MNAMDTGQAKVRAALVARVARRDQLPWLGHSLELALYLGAYLVYLLTRGLIFPDPQVALDNADRIISAEQALGIFREPGWQAWIIAQAPALAAVFNWVYILTYFPLVLGLGLILYLFRRPTYGYYRAVIVINLALALLIFMLFPLAPPYLASADVVDTIQTFGPTFYGGPGMDSLYNSVAAMPSLHFSWSVIFGALFFRTLRGWFKVLGLLYPVLTFFAITLTGNHYILDALAGGVLAGVAFAVMELGLRGRGRPLRRSRTATR